MTIYILNILSLILYCFLYTKAENKLKMRKIIIILIVIQFSLIQGLRAFEIGSDTQKYIQYYEFIKNSNYTIGDLLLNPPLNFEFGYLALMKICSFFNLTPRMFLMLISIILNSLIGLFIYKESDDFIMSFWIFIGIEFFTLSFTMIRQMIAIALVLNSYIYITEKKYFRYLILNFSACLFHKTAIVFLLFFFFKIFKNYLNYKKLKLHLNLVAKIFFLILTIFLIVFIFDDIITYASHMFYSYYNFTKSDLGFLWVTMIGILIFFLGIEKNERRTEKLCDYQMLIYISSCFQLMTIHISQFSRGAFYFYIFTIVSLPYALTLIENKSLKKFFKYSIYLLTFLQYILFSINIYNLVPYKLL